MVTSPYWVPVLTSQFMKLLMDLFVYMFGDLLDISKVTTIYTRVCLAQLFFILRRYM